MGLLEFMEVRTACAVLGEEREARLVEGREVFTVEVRLEDLIRRVEEDVDARREDVESWPAA